MNIYAAIIKVMDEVGVVGKSSTNKDQGYKYRGVDAVMTHLQPAMIKHGIFCTPEVLEHTREIKTTAKGNQLLYSIIKMKYTFYAEDGSSVSAIVVGEGMDSGDKASNKAMSVAFKYACFQVFCIPTEEMIDPDKENPIAQADGTDTTAEQPVENPASEAQIKYIKTLCSKGGITYEQLLESNGISGTPTKTQASNFINGFAKKGIK